MLQVEGGLRDMELLKDWGESLWQLLKSYWTYGRPFLALHGVIVFIILFDSWYRKIRQETNALRRWEPRTNTNQPNSRSGGITKILDQFVEESEVLGTQGFFVPMMDFSNRLDSMVDGMVAELHNRINLLLVVGIAGTLFGVFEFAFQAYSVIQREGLEAGARVLALGEFLSRSMAKAFPVGFMGLVLMLGFQIWAAFPERNLRIALAEATRKALQRRKEVSISQAEIVRQSAQAIQQAMEPIKDLQETLMQSVQPVVEEFGKRLDQSLNLVRTQFEQLQIATSSVHEAVKGVEYGVTSLQAVTNSLKGFLQNVPDVLQNVIQIQQRQQESFQEFDKILREHLEQARRVTTTLDSTIQRLSEGIEEVFKHLSEDSIKVWQEMSNELGRSVQNTYINYLDNIRDHAGKIRESLENAAREWHRVAQNAETLLRDPLMQAISCAQTELSEALQRLDQVLAQRYPQVVQDIQRFTEGLMDLLRQVKSVQETLTLCFQNAQQIRGVLIDTLYEIQQTKPFDENHIASLLQTSINELKEANRLLEQIWSRMPPAGDGIDSKLQDLVQILTQIRECILFIKNEDSIIRNIVRKVSRLGRFIPGLKGR
jgi:ABC-type transporter Mla subunit MlaD